MVKKISSQKKKNKTIRKAKTVGYYLRIYFLSVFVAAIVFVTGTLLLKPTQPCANSKSCNSDLSLNINNTATGIFEGHTVIPPKIDPIHDLLQPKVLGADTNAGDKHIYVDLAAQTLYAYEGTTQIMKTLISSGKWGPTPIGNFHIWEKLRSTRMAGGEGADAYDLPNVPYVMYFYNDWGLHGAYWHDNFGHAMSHGCVNMRTVDAATLFAWADGPNGNTPGTAVSICNQFTAPNNCVQNNPIN